MCVCGETLCRSTVLLAVQVHRHAEVRARGVPRAVVPRDGGRAWDTPLQLLRHHNRRSIKEEQPASIISNRRRRLPSKKSAYESSEKQSADAIRRYKPDKAGIRTKVTVHVKHI